MPLSGTQGSDGKARLHARILGQHLPEEAKLGTCRRCVWAFLGGCIWAQGFQQPESSSVPYSISRIPK